jgi:hypothetical protein
VQLYELFSEPDVVKTITIGRLRWASHVIQILDDNPVKKLTLLNPDGCRRVGRPKLRWMDGIEDERRILGVRGW